jgi:hypothetical protein
LVFFEVLEPYILSRSITVVPAGVLQALLGQYKSLGRMRRVELCLLNLEVRFECHFNAI